MRELSTYFCPHCGYYAYYQLEKNAVCPKCTVKMTQLDMEYQEFMNLTCEERDRLLAHKILASCSTLTERLCAPHRLNNTREIIGIQQVRILELEAENKKLNETVAWMHETIWDMVRTYKIPDFQKNCESAK